MTSKIEISHKTIIFTVVLLAGLWLIFQIRDILFLLFIAFILTSALRPLVNGLTRLRLPRIFSILLIYALIFGVLGVSLAESLPLLLRQLGHLISDLPTLVARVMPYWDIDWRSFTQQIAPISENIVKFTVGIFSNLLTTMTVLVFTFYFLLEQRWIEGQLKETVGEEIAGRIMMVTAKIERRLGDWVRGQLLLMFTIGFLTYWGLVILHVDFALSLAIIAGILEIVPFVGPIVAAIPAILVALVTSPFLALSVVALYFIVQQGENHLLVPWVMRKSVGLSPLITIVALMIGGKLAGLVGALLAVPLVLVLQVLIVELITEKQTKA